MVNMLEKHVQRFIETFLKTHFLIEGKMQKYSFIEFNSDKIFNIILTEYRFVPGVVKLTEIRPRFYKMLRVKKIFAA